MSMTSYRNSDEPFDFYVMGDGKLEPATEITRHSAFRVSLKQLPEKDIYKTTVYYARYYCENADPIWETARRGVLFQ